MPNRHDFSRPTIIILLAIRSLAKTQQLMLLNGETTIELLHTSNQSGNLSERVILLKRSLIIIEKIVSIARFLFSFFPFFFFAHVSTEARKSEISESNCREFYTRSAILEILPTPAGYSRFDDRFACSFERSFFPLFFFFYSRIKARRGRRRGWTV